MNKTINEAQKLSKEIAANVTADDCEVVICPPFVNLEKVVEAVHGNPVKVGAQNMHFEESGAYTGEISADMLLAIGVTYVIIGHSERREYFVETDETVNKKTIKAIEKGLIPIVCVGESLEQRKSGIMKDWITGQTMAALKGLTAQQVADLVIAYEPIWAIGTGETASPEQAEEVCKLIRDVIEGEFGKDASDSTRILYGGSMNAKNAESLLSKEDIDGGLIGGASLKTEDFMTIIRSAK